MNLFFNPTGVGNVAFLQLEQGEGPFEYERHGDVVAIKDNQKIVGFNLFEATNHLNIEGVGHIKLTETLLAEIQKMIDYTDLDYQIEADLSPKFVVGYVQSKEKHPNADKLSIVQVDVGTETLQIVCGAPNIDQGQKVVVAKVGAVMPSGMIIKDAELRGVPSSGMVCSMKELDLPNAPQEKGIMVLDDHYQVGQPFFDE
ncbi:TPA: YtpR family tRNA-binding protein [Staphylococcus pseudintermedius]